MGLLHTIPVCSLPCYHLCAKKCLALFTSGMESIEWFVQKSFTFQSQISIISGKPFQEWSRGEKLSFCLSAAFLLNHQVCKLVLTILLYFLHCTVFLFFFVFIFYFFLFVVNFVIH